MAAPSTSTRRSRRSRRPTDYEPVNEEDIIVFDPPTPEKVQLATVVEPGVERSNSDSDSSSSNSPVVKKKRVTRTALNPGAFENEETQNSAVYTGHVNDLFMKAKPPMLTDCHSDPDDVEERQSVFTKRISKQTPGKNQKASKPSTPVPQFVMSDDEDEDDVLILDSQSPISRDRERSPTPPPSEAGYNRVRRTRISKQSKKAIGQLNSIRGRYMMESVVSSLDLPDNQCITVGESPEKRGLVLKIRTVHGIDRIEMLPNETFEHVVTQMAKRLKTDPSNLVLYYGDQTVELFDTPSCIGLTVADILDCHTVSQAANESDSNDSFAEIDDPSMIRLQVRSQDESKRREPVIIKIKRKRPLEKLMREYSQKTGQDFEKMIFHFDGEIVRNSSTAESHAMENDDILDVTCS